MSDPLIPQLKTLLIDTLNLDDVSPDDLEDNEPLIGSGLNLDSIDALELVVQLEKRYGIKIANAEESRTALASLNALAAYVRAHAAPDRLPAD